MAALMRILGTCGQRLLFIFCLVALFLTSSGCGGEWRKRFGKMVQDTKQQHKAADIQSALVPFFADEHMLTNQLPKEISSLPIFADDPTGIYVWPVTTNNTVLMLVIGSGFGHWGILVARPGHDNEISPWHRKRLTPWEDGIYFYDGE